MAKKLERIGARLAKMQERNDELREQIESRDTSKKKMVADHAEAMRLLKDQQTRLHAVQVAEKTAHDNETNAIQTRRDELKEDYGELKPLYDQLETGE